MSHSERALLRARTSRAAEWPAKSRRPIAAAASGPSVPGSASSASTDQGTAKVSTREKWPSGRCLRMVLYQRSWRLQDRCQVVPRDKRVLTGVADSLTDWPLAATLAPR